MSESPSPALWRESPDAVRDLDAARIKRTSDMAIVRDLMGRWSSTDPDVSRMVLDLLGRLAAAQPSRGDGTISPLFLKDIRAGLREMRADLRRRLRSGSDTD